MRRPLWCCWPAPDGSNAGWVNIRSRNRGLLSLILFTDVGRHDAPTRLLCGSHVAVPQFLAPYGEAGTDSDADFWRPSVLCLNAAHATGKAGDVFLCHPFMVHTATFRFSAGRLPVSGIAQSGQFNSPELPRAFGHRVGAAAWWLSAGKALNGVPLAGGNCSG